MTMAPVVRVAIVGLGVAGASMAAAISRHPHLMLDCAADPNPALRERFARDYGLAVFDDARSLFKSSGADAVYIASPHQYHKEHATSAAMCGKHVIVEKPMALSLSDCDTMVEAAAHSKTVLMVGYTHGFDPSVRLIRNLIESGEYGRLAMLASLNYTDFLYRPRRPEELDTSSGGGIFYNQLPHQVDMLRVLANSPVRSVRAMAGVLDSKRPTEGCVSAFLDFESAAAATLSYSGYDHFDSDELHGWVGEAGQPRKPSHGAARARLAGLGTPGEEAQARADLGYGGRSRSSPHKSPRQPHFGMLIVTCEKADFRQSADGILIYGDAGVREITLDRAPVHAGRMAMLDEFHEAVVTGRRPLHNGEFGRETVKICLALLESAREHREVLLGGPKLQAEARS